MGEWQGTGYGFGIGAFEKLLMGYHDYKLFNKLQNHLVSICGDGRTFFEDPRKPNTVAYCIYHTRPWPWGW